MYPRGSQASRYLTGQRTGRRAHISVKAPPPSPETGHNGFGSVDALREEIESRHPRVSWVSHVHGPYPYPVIRRGRSNRSSPEGCGTPCVVGEGEGPLVGTPALPHLALIHRSAWRDCMKKPQVRANRLSMRRLMAAYTNASLIAHNFS
jgi:hypothetical protein